MSHIFKCFWVLCLFTTMMLCYIRPTFGQIAYTFSFNFDHIDEATGLNTFYSSGTPVGYPIEYIVNTGGNLPSNITYNDVGEKFVLYNKSGMEITEENPIYCFGSLVPSCGFSSIRLKKAPDAQTVKIEKYMPDIQNSVVSLKFYDDAVPTTEFSIAISDGSGTRRVLLQVTQSTYKVQFDDGSYQDTQIARSAGWRQLDFFITNAGSYLEMDKIKLFSSQVSAITSLRSLKVFTHPNTNQGRMQIDNIFVHNRLSDYVSPVVDPLRYIKQVNLLTPQVTQNATSHTVEMVTGKHKAVLNLDTGSVSVTDLSTSRVYASSGGALYDGEKQLINLTYTGMSGNILTFQVVDAGITYKIYFAFASQGILINVSANKEILPRMQVYSPPYVYGLGELQSGNDGHLYVRKGYKDDRFGTGWKVEDNRELIDDNMKVQYTFHSDLRDRVPILVSPQSLVLYSLFDDKLKSIYNLTDKITMGVNQPVQSFQRAFAFITGSTPLELFSNFHTLRKQLSYDVISPKYTHFGLGYEIWRDFGCEADGKKVIDRILGLRSLGVNLDWVTLGSGWWSGKNVLGCVGDVSAFNKPQDPTTDSFAYNSRYTTRYPEYGNMNFFEWSQSNNIKVFGGMRTNISSENTSVVQEALSNNYLMRNSDGSVFHTYQWGNGTSLVLVDPQNPQARTWFLNKTKAYTGMSGWKEDLMLPNYLHFGQYLSEDKTWPVMAEFSKNGYYQRCRNEYFSVTCDVQLIQDLVSYAGGTNYTQNTVHHLDKILLYSLQHSLSGYYAPAMEIGSMPDNTVSLNDPVRQRLYLHEVMMNTFTTNFDLSRPVWTVFTDPFYMQKFQFFSGLHKRLQNYIYDSVIESVNTGIPYAMMPLVLAYPNDSKTYDMGSVTYGLGSTPDFTKAGSMEYLFGKAMLVAPVITYESARQVYLPSGVWYDLFTGKRYSGGATISYDIYGTDSTGGQTMYPVFVKGGEPYILPGFDSSDSPFRIRILPLDNAGSTYHHYSSGNTVTSVKPVSSTVTISVDGVWNTNWVVSDFEVVEGADSRQVTFDKQSKNELSFVLEEGKNYIVRKKIIVITPTKTPTPYPPFQTVISYYGTANTTYDFDQNGKVNMLDVGRTLSR